MFAQALSFVEGEEGYGSCLFVDYGSAYHGVRLVFDEVF